MLDFTGQVAIVTGAGNGLGRRYALDLAARGARVVVNDIGVGVDGTANAESPATRVVEEIRAAGGEAVAATASVASTEGGESIVEQALASFGGLDILVNDAGIARTNQDGCRRHDPGAGTGGGYPGMIEGGTKVFAKAQPAELDELFTGIANGPAG
jgi:NAD(P)-dependent dehydrogenase (short-subunit alcohol dehydrogenase family)